MTHVSKSDTSYLMTILINGKETTIETNLTIYEIVCQISESPPPSGIAVALNMEVIPRSQWKEKRVTSEDEIEVLWASSGG